MGGQGSMGGEGEVDVEGGDEGAGAVGYAHVFTQTSSS